MTANVLAQKAVLAGLTIRQWAGQKLDRRITDEVNQQYHAQRDAGHYSKQLIARAHFKPIDKITNEARTAFLMLTLPWLDTGTRILPSMAVDQFINHMRDYKQDFIAAADRFARNYPTYLKDAEQRLNGMFRAEDYPAPGAVRRLFNFSTSIVPCPDSSDFRVKLAKEQADDIRTELDERMKEALTVAMRDPVNRIVINVEHMVERLTKYKPAADDSKAEGWFRDSLVSNLRGLVGLLPALNLTGDVVLAKLTERIKTELCTTEPGELRKDETARGAVVEAAESILEQAKALMA